MNAPLFETQRRKVLGAFAAANQPFVARTIPYHSMCQLKLEVVNADGTNGFAFAVARRNSVLEFFNYGLGQNIPLGADTVRAGEAETNLAKASSTNGAADYVIEGIGFSAAGALVEYPNTDPFDTAPTDADVLGAIGGTVHMCDPAALVMPPQVQSPFNLEDAIQQALMPLMSLELEWDRKRYEKLGIIDLLPQAGAKSYLRANGQPSAENRYRIPEGYLWRRDGQPDSEFIARARLERPLVVPISLVTPPGGTVATPTAIYLPLIMRVFGLSVDLPSGN